jgi:hypothetical protein
LLEEGISESLRTGARSQLVAHCHHGLGRLYSQTSQREQARIELLTAITMYRSYGYDALATADGGSVGADGRTMTMAESYLQVSCYRSPNTSARLIRPGNMGGLWLHTGHAPCRDRGGSGAHVADPGQSRDRRNRRMPGGGHCVVGRPSARRMVYGRRACSCKARMDRGHCRLRRPEPSAVPCQQAPAWRRSLPPCTAVQNLLQRCVPERMV